METSPSVAVVGLLIGVVAGSRAMTAPAAVSWAARLGYLDLESSWLAFLGHAWTPWILTLLAAVELVIDQLPRTPSRTMPGPFGARILSGAFSGATLGAARGSLVLGLLTGAAGAVIGTFGGHALRARLATAFGNDHPAAFLEDALAIGLALVVVLALK